MHAAEILQGPGFHDVQELAAQADIDLISVVVRVPGHRDVVMAAFEGGKHVFSEWPLGANLDQAQEMTARGEADMARMTRELIDGVAAMGGAYYLPYRLHATQDQFLKNYPQAPDFVAQKRAIDPELRFRNALWDTYMEGL